MDATASVRDALAPTGRLRATINLGNPVLAQRHGPDGRLGGISVALAEALGRRLGVPVDLVPFDAAGRAFAALREGACDVGFLAVDPLRAADLVFTAPYVLIEGTYLVRDGSHLREIEDVDRADVRIAAGRNAAYDLHLSRTLRHARLAYAPTSQAAMDLFLAAGLEAAAGVRQPLQAFAARHPGLRVMAGRFMGIEQAMAIPKGREAGEDYVRGFLEDAKTSGFVAEALGRSGQGDAAVAPPA